MHPERRGIVRGLHIAGIVFLGIAILMFLMAAVEKVRSPHQPGQRTAVAASKSAPTTTTTTATIKVTPVAPPAPQPAVTQPRQCRTADLTITDSGGQDSGGMFFGTIVLRNVGTSPCTLYGYAGLQRLDARGRPLPTTVVRDRHQPTSLVTMAPQQPASFGYSTQDRPSNRFTVCSHATTVDVTPPDETTAAKVGSHLVACGTDGIVTVGPIVAGAGASIAGSI